MKMLFKYIFLLSITFFASTVHAQLINPIGGSITMDTIPQLISAILDVVVRIGSVVLVFMIIYSGYIFVTAQGNMEQLTKAKHTLKWAIIGGALLLGAWALSLGIGETIDNLSSP